MNQFGLINIGVLPHLLETMGSSKALRSDQAPEGRPKKKSRDFNPAGWGHPTQGDRAAGGANLQQSEREVQHRTIWQQHRARVGKSDRQDWQERGGYGGHRIPVDSYRSRYGPGHPFRLINFPLEVVDGWPRFQFGGLWFSVMESWPDHWPDDWYGRDDMYIESFGGGYYLQSRRYPMDRIAITVLAR